MFCSFRKGNAIFVEYERKERFVFNCHDKSGERGRFSADDACTARVFAPRVMQTEACHPIRPAHHSWKYTFFTLPLTDVSTS